MRVCKHGCDISDLRVLFYISNRALFSRLQSLILTHGGGLGEFSKVMHTLDYVSGLFLSTLKRKAVVFKFIRLEERF